MTPLDLMLTCAPLIAPVTLSAIVQQESAGHPLALHDNTTGTSYRPSAATEAAALARRLIEQGHSVDIGLAQINSRNLPSLGLSVDQALEPCNNLGAAQAVLTGAWRQSGGDLRGTLAAYNTGKVSSSVGLRYGAQVYGHAGVTVPAVPGGQLARWTQSSAVGARVEEVEQRVSARHPSASFYANSTPAASGLAPKGGALTLPLSKQE